MALQRLPVIFVLSWKCVGEEFQCHRLITIVKVEVGDQGSRRDTMICRERRAVRANARVKVWGSRQSLAEDNAAGLELSGKKCLSSRRPTKPRLLDV